MDPVESFLEGLAAVLVLLGVVDSYPFLEAEQNRQGDVALRVLAAEP